MIWRREAAATMRSYKRAPPKPLMRSQAGSTSSAPSTVTSRVPTSRPTRGTPTSRARVAVSWEVGTPRARKPARTRSARARSASKAMAAGSTSSLMGVRWPGLSSVWPTRLLPALGEKLGDHAGPARLVAGPQAGPVVAVEVLVEERQAAPVRVALELLGAAEDRAAPVRPREKEAVETPRDIRGHVPEAHEAARAGRARGLEVVAEEVMELLQRLDEEKVNGEPDGTAPVGVPTKEPGGGLGRLVVHPVFLIAHAEDIGTILVIAGQRPDAMRREELLLVEHEAENSGQLLPGDDGEHDALATPRLVLAAALRAWLRVVVDEPLRPPHEARQPLRHLRIPRLDGEEGDEADERAQLHGAAEAVRQVEHVVEEAVLLFPQAHFLAAHVVGGMGDVDEVLEELARHVLVCPVGLRQLQRHGQ